jgi:dihydroorotate dehydrogenase
MLGRLLQSKSLMVNKGFKNLGAKETISRLLEKTFPIPVGISIGRTNSRTSNLSQSQSVQDICEAFKKIEDSTVPFSYYELNISCPNLHGSANFYKPRLLSDLLAHIDKLKLKKPVFVKMPIDKPESEFRAMLRVISKHSPVGVIIGNLQKNRSHPSLNPSEVAKFPVGYFSGKPTFDDSNRLIELAYRTYAKRFVIIGCGGVFSGADAFEKIKRGASLIQLITGLIYQGPQLPSQITLELTELLDKNGFSTIEEAIGCGVKQSLCHAGPGVRHPC